MNLTEDEIRHITYRLMQPETTPNIIAGLGQMTSFKELGQQLGIKEWYHINKKPDGWVFPRNNRTAIIVELKGTHKNLDKPVIRELQQNMYITLKYYNSIIGIAFNGYQSKLFYLTYQTKNIQHLSQYDNQLIRPYQFYLNLPSIINQNKINQKETKSISEQTTISNVSPIHSQSSKVTTNTISKSNLLKLNESKIAKTVYENTKTKISYDLDDHKWYIKTNQQTRQYETWQKMIDQKHGIYKYIYSALNQLSSTYNTERFFSTSKLNNVANLLTADTYLGSYGFVKISSQYIFKSRNVYPENTPIKLKKWLYLFNYLQEKNIIEYDPHKFVKPKDLYETVRKTNDIEMKIPSYRVFLKEIKPIFQTDHRSSGSIRVGIQIKFNDQLLIHQNPKNTLSKIKFEQIYPKLQNNPYYQFLLSQQEK